ncbi:MAG: GNAT family N-acetyltransferase [Streptosporangiaceae bacterium]
MEVRQARAADRSGVTETMVAAFRHDPAWQYIVGEEQARTAALFAAVLFDSRVDDGTVWMTGRADAVALWEAPGGPGRSGGHRRAWNRFRAEAGPAVLRRLDRYENAVAAIRPHSAHWYLGVLATRPDHQGRGLPARVLAPAFQLADAAGLPCCLETSNARNRTYYQRHGFTVSTPIVIPDGPATWWLERLPASDASAGSRAAIEHPGRRHRTP